MLPMNLSILQSKPTVSLATVMPAGLLNLFTVGAANTLYGPSLVYMAQETGQRVEALGLLFVLHWAGFFFSTFAANGMARRFEMRRGTMLGAMLIALGALGLVVLPFPFNFAGAFLLGFGNGASEVLFNRLIELLAGDTPGAALTRLHSTYGVGAVIIPLVVGGATAFGLNWRLAGFFVAAAALLDVYLIARWDEFRMPHGEGVHWRRIVCASSWHSISLFIVLFVVYVGVETAVGGWVTTFFAKQGQSAILGAIATSLFFLTFSLARVLFASATDRLGLGRTVRIGLLTGTGALLLTFDSTLAIVGFAVAGIALAVVFPTLLAWAPRRHPELRAQMMSLAIASAGLGGIIVPFLVGIGVGVFGAWALTPILIGLILPLVGLSLLERDSP